MMTVNPAIPKPMNKPPMSRRATRITLIVFFIGFPDLRSTELSSQRRRNPRKSFENFQIQNRIVIVFRNERE